MLKKATVLLIVFTLIVSFSMTAFASTSGAECGEDRAEICDGKLYTPADPTPNDNAVSEDDGGSNENKKGHGPNNPLYVAGE